MLLEYKHSEFIIQKDCFLKDKGKPSTKKENTNIFLIYLQKKRA